MALVGGEYCNSNVLSFFRPDDTAQIYAIIRFHEECSSPFGFSVLPYILWQTSDGNQFQWKAADELLIDDFHDDMNCEDLSGIFYHHP